MPLSPAPPRRHPDSRRVRDLAPPPRGGWLSPLIAWALIAIYLGLFWAVWTMLPVGMQP